jgi:predicted ATPase
MTKSKKALTVTELVKAITSKFQKYPQGYIRYIRFPRFKNLAPNARLDLNFPLTALIGPNGSGKTTVLHALYGAPKGQSTSDYWFSTACDPIEEGGGEVSRYIYGHMQQGQVVETRKARVSKKDRPDYWEPTKATVADAMVFDATQPEIKGVRSSDRWNPVEKNVLYLNFRSELSAFDKFMFFGGKQSSAVGRKQDAVRWRSAHLKRVMDSGVKTYSFFGAQRISDNRKLPQEELDAVSEILGRKYDSAQSVVHQLFENRDGMSVRFFQDSLVYTEAFAGSGEVAVVSMVSKIFACNQPTLILLDEPEVSLHPGAQQRLTRFLLQAVLERNHQIVLSTHSPHLADALPSHAIKAFVTGAGGKFEIENDCHASAAFNVLGATPPDKLQVFVEDRLGETIVKRSLSLLSPAERALFSVVVLPGGSESYLTHRIPQFMANPTDKSLVLLDGDKLRVPPAVVRGADEFSKSEESKLLDYIKKVTGVEPLLLIDGSDGQGNQTQKISLQRQYLDYVRGHLRFLPRKCPEEILHRLIDPGYVATSSAQAKSDFRAHFREIDDDLRSNEMEGWASVEFAKNVENNIDAQEVAKVLKEALRFLD